MKVIMVDLDGTLVDTKEMNYRAYKEAIEPYGFSIDYEYYCDFCNGRHYREFLPQITTNDNDILSDMHKRKKEAYSKYLYCAKLNVGLVAILQSWKNAKVVLVTTASKVNTYQVLEHFGIVDLFDLILTGEDVTNSKPDPEGYLKAMDILGVSPAECVIFEDSEVGIQAAQSSGATVFVAKGYN